ncbi:uncharacterized protein PGRI_020790 [Penicillium griseofulvum]|uniref:Uncharacterized protein n=1 Tax=Penicillium patulum TaxID=5078 RepID=A0A135LGY2_PENPA|nr:uncharacterized protein PGRI_020790 [Penicillium griseofulvum]KXG48209.1 hypothetical protein PGRI_020790 [Penicillium griseofulvum]
MSLEWLPTELILMIESNIESKKDLNALICTNTRFFLMFEDKLYKTNTAKEHAAIILWAAKRGLSGTILKCLTAGATVPLLDRFKSHLKDRNAPESITVLPRYPKPHPLTVAAEIGSMPCVRLLIRQGVNPNFLDDNYETPMRQAAGNGHVKVVKFLLKDADAFTGEFKLRRPLKLAAARGHLEVLKVLFSFLDEAPRLLTVKDAAQIIMYEGLWHCHEDVVKFALSKGADVNDESPKPTLRFISDLRSDEHPYRQPFKLTQKHKTIQMIDGVETPGWVCEIPNPLYAALLSRNERILLLMFDYGCDLQQLGPEALRYAILKKDHVLISRLLRMGMIFTPRSFSGGFEQQSQKWENLMMSNMNELGFRA